jgi:sigma-B regulation protein RsbU (phosphoserine phosphatase)
LDAALQTQAAKHTLRAFALDCASPAQVLVRTNDAICRMLPADVFITLFYALLNTETRVLTWANAGHDPALICHLDSSITQLESSGRALGLLSRADYMEFTTPLAAGDVLLMYTDGVTEARNDGVFLETSGVAEILCRNAHLSAREVVDHVYSEVREYASGNLHDDIALLAVKVMDTSGIAILSPALC